MKKTVAIGLIAIIFLQLSGGSAIASAFNTSSLTTTHYTKGTHCTKHQQTDLFNLSQFLEVEDTEEGVAKSIAFPVSDQLATYNFLPSFTTANKHFLIHFASAIKDRLPNRKILYCTFLI
ncbi:MAG TPA: hypothetical protein VIN07_01295 [Flavipsychrobacter sp.]